MKSPATLDFLISPATLDFLIIPATLDFLIIPATLDFLISPAVAGFFYISQATAGRVLKILTMLLYEGIQE